MANLRRFATNEGEDTSDVFITSTEVLGARGPGQRRFSAKDRIPPFTRTRRRRVAFNEGPNEAMAEFKDVGTPACTREKMNSQLNT